MSGTGAAPRAAVVDSAPPRATAPVSAARAAASRRNGARSRGPTTAEGKARARLNAIRHGMRAAMHVVLPQEDAVAFAALQTQLFEELAPVGALQLVLARRIVIAAWRLARADRMEAEALAFRSYDAADAGLALVRDGNSTRAVETLLRYRNTAMAEFTRALGTLQALQAEPAANDEVLEALDEPDRRPAPRAAPNEPERPPRDGDPAPDVPQSGGSCQRPAQSNGYGRKASQEPASTYALPNEPEPRRTLHEAAAPWRPSQAAADAMPKEPEADAIPGEIARHAPSHESGPQTSAGRAIE